MVMIHPIARRISNAVGTPSTVYPVYWFPPRLIGELCFQHLHSPSIHYLMTRRNAPSRFSQQLTTTICIVVIGDIFGNEHTFITYSCPTTALT